MASAYAATSGLRLREFGDGVLVFQPVSWEVHILNPAAAAVLQACQDGPRSAESVAELLGQLIDESDVKALRLQSADLLVELEQLGLLQRA